jgi:TolA-binding protein
LLGALALGFLELQLFHAQNNHHAQLEALVVSDLVPLWQPVVTVTAQTETISPRHLAALLQATTERLERVAATTEYLANRGEGITRVAEQVANLSERIESLRTTLQNIENDRTADLRHELRTIARLLARQPGQPRDADDHAPPA